MAAPALAFVVLGLFTASQAPAASSPSDAACSARLCLAPVGTLGMDPDERAAVEAALVRALDAPRCAQPILVDDTCFGDDACVQRAAPDGFVAVRAVRAGSELRLSWVAKKPGRVARGEHVASAIPFYASGMLDHDIADGACDPAAPAAPAATTAPLPSPAPPAETPPSSSTLPSPPLIAIAAGGTVAAVSLVVFAVSALALESADTDGATKETAFFAGWLGMGGAVAGAGVAAAGAYFLEP